MKGKYKRINSFAIPLFLNNITALIIGLCDAAIVGRVSTEAFASVTLIANTINSIVGVLGSVSLALNIIGAKLKGKNDEKQCCYAHHNGKFAIDEDSLEIGTALYAQYAVDFLNKYEK